MNAAEFRQKCQEDPKCTAWLIDAMEFLFQLPPAKAAMFARALKRYADMLTKENLSSHVPPAVKAVSSTILAQQYFYAAYQATFGKAYVASFGKDGAIFKDLLKLMTIDEVKGLIDQFFCSQDAFVLKSGHSTGVFKGVINKLRNPITEQDAILKQAGIR